MKLLLIFCSLLIFFSDLTSARKFNQFDDSILRSKKCVNDVEIELRKNDYNLNI